jgi:hypothetical protein
MSLCIFSISFLTDVAVVVGRNRRDLADLVLVLDVLVHLLDLGLGELDGLVDAALERHGVDAGSHGLQSFLGDGVGQNGGGGGTVASDVVGLDGHFLHQLRAHVLEGILELDLTGDGNAVLGHGGGSELLVQKNIASLGSERHHDSPGELLDAAEQRTAGLFGEE